MKLILVIGLLITSCTFVGNGRVVEGRCIERVTGVFTPSYDHEIRHFKMGCIQLYEEQRAQIRKNCRTKHPQSDVEFEACLCTSTLPALTKEEEG